jgi:hypothetical protein
MPQFLLGFGYHFGSKSLSRHAGVISAMVSSSGLHPRLVRSVFGMQRVPERAEAVRAGMTIAQLSTAEEAY